MEILRQPPRVAHESHASIKVCVRTLVDGWENFNQRRNPAACFDRSLSLKNQGVCERNIYASG
jgi:hypothetical protein